MLRIAPLHMACAINGSTSCVLSIDFHLFEAIGGCNFFKDYTCSYRLISYNDKRDLLTLPVRLGGFGVVNPQSISDSKFAASKKVIFPLSDTSAKIVIWFSCHRCSAPGQV